MLKLNECKIQYFRNLFRINELFLKIKLKNGISHIVKNPVALFQGYVRMLSSGISTWNLVWYGKCDSERNPSKRTHNEDCNTHQTTEVR